jgi:hypothetical protein
MRAPLRHARKGSCDQQEQHNHACLRALAKAAVKVTKN